jgi:hypothetical protein
VKRWRRLGVGDDGREHGNKRSRVASKSDAIGKREHWIGTKRIDGRLGSDKKGWNWLESIGKWRGDRRRAFSSVKWKCSRVISGRPTGAIAGVQVSCIEHVLIDKTLVSARECVDILHHASWPMDDGEVVTEEFLSPATDDVDLTIVVEDFFHSAAVANPIKHSAPKIFLVLGDTPATASSFADK